jgi:hypothetical protein
MSGVLQLAIFESATGRMLADWSYRAQDVEFTTNRHGYAALTAHIDLPMADAFYWYDRPGLPWMEVCDNANLLWRGRLEDVRIVPSGIELTALGPWSAFGDLPYTNTPSATTTADVIVTDILDTVLTTNTDQLSASTYRIEDPGVSVYDEIYEDEDMRKILTRLAALGDDQTPPQRWEVGVWDDLLHFRPRGTDGYAWFVDASNLDVERSLGSVYNSVYTRYDDGASTTATATDSMSVTRYGLTRRMALDSRTTDGTAAALERDAQLADSSDPIPRASVPINRVYTATGTAAPLYMVRSGDTITLRNLPPEAGESIDRIRTFYIAETRYNCDDNTLEVTPESPLPRLDVLIARALEVPRVE